MEREHQSDLGDILTYCIDGSCPPERVSSWELLRYINGRASPSWRFLADCPSNVGHYYRTIIDHDHVGIIHPSPRAICTSIFQIDRVIAFSPNFREDAVAREC